MTFPLAKLLKRDPRMVERKKTGRAKARKAVSLHVVSASSSHNLFLAVHLGQALMWYRRAPLEAMCYNRIMPTHVVVIYACSRMRSRLWKED